MTDTIRKSQTAFSALFPWRTLKTRVTLFTLAIFLVGIWSLAFYASYTLKSDMEHLLSNQQFSIASIMATDINREIADRLQWLEQVSRLINPAMLGNAASMQRFLEDRPAFKMLFNRGGAVARLDGVVIAEVPISTRRIGVNYRERDWMIEALTGKSVISKPVTGKTSRAPVFIMATPMKDNTGKVIGVLWGTTDLSRANFLNLISDNSYGKTGGYLLVVPQLRTIIYATDKTHIMEVLPARGVNPLIDRAIEGWEGSGIAHTPSGVEVLTSIKSIPVSGWYVAAIMPTEEAFAPILAMQKRMLLATIFLTLLAGGLTWWMLKRQLAPVFTTVKTLAVLSDTDHPLQPLPIARQDEIGELIGAFNRLLEALGQRGEELRESEEKYRDIFENSTEGICQATPAGRFIRVNPAMAQIYGYESPADMIAGVTDIARQLYIHSEDRVRYKALLEAQGVIKGFETTSPRKDGTTIWVSLSSHTKKDANGNVLYFDTMVEDITDRKRAEEEKRNLEERLQRSEKMEALGLLAGGVAHDLNNVLGIVVGYAELILESVDASSPIKPHLANIMNGGQKAAAIVNDLLTLARRGVSGKEVLNLNEIIADCRQSPELDKLFSYHPSVKINSDLEPDLPNITCSSVHLGKSLYNLVSNACEAMPKGGIVTIKTTNQYLEQPLHGYDEIRSGDYVVLSVSDTGEGISANDLKRIFEPFYTKKTMGRSGTGLGLAVVWGTVKDHHGYINVQSEKGKGSIFTLYFPATREDITAEGVPASISEYLGKGESILVVDDVKEQRDLAAGMLDTLNYKVASVGSGEEAVAYLNEHEVDIVVLDMIMDPGMDGLDTYRNIIEIRPKQRAIIVSGFSESDRVQEAQGLGAGAYVKKPYIKEKLGVAVRKELDRSAC